MINGMFPPGWWVSYEVQFCPEHRPGLFGQPK